MGGALSRYSSRFSQDYWTGGVSCGLFEFFQGLGHVAEAFVDEAEDGAGFEFSVAIFHSG